MTIVDNPILPSCAPSERIRCGVCAHGVCGVLSVKERAELDKGVRRTTYSAKEQLFTQGDEVSRIFNIADGVVRVYKMLADGRRQVIGFVMPGDFLGVTRADHHTLSADAIGQASVCSFQRASFMRLVDANMSLLRRMNEFACKELALAQKRMTILGRYSAEEKIAAFVMGWRDRMARRGRASAYIPLPMSRRDIADYLGLTIETVSRTFTKLERDQVIVVVPGGVRVVDDARAARLAAAEMAGP